MNATMAEACASRSTWGCTEHLIQLLGVDVEAVHDDYFFDVMAGRVPNQFPKGPVVDDFGMKDWGHGLLMQSHGFFGLVAAPMADALALLLRGQVVLEVGAGRGLLARSLRDRHVEVIATDRSEGKVDPLTGTHVVKANGKEAVRRYGKQSDVLLLVCPDRAEDYVEVIRTWAQLKGAEARVIVVGESPGGCHLPLEADDYLRLWPDFPGIPYRSYHHRTERVTGYLAQQSAWSQ
ncbi:class I SAM-dependent methyltransferase [Ferrimonas marina]|uniref:Methyltransferase domain-containing protein n=1 Tax=Ferrimonas marina TaxID=299255 RepID=A0A1M5UGM3_9GAMM|nr:hypothetical protein [Ferrimonas marina]SHH62164.1 hypothetical protein SAMN02745129_2564 [Ferrimonas marina]